MQSAFHRKLVRWSAVTLCVASMLAFTGNANAFCRSTTCKTTTMEPCTTDEDGCPSSGKKLFWTSSCIGFAVNEDGTSQLKFADAKRIIEQSFRKWSDVDCGTGTASMTFSPMENVPCHTSQYNASKANVNVVLFQDNDWKYRGIDGTLAKTSVTFNETTGEIYDADIEVNAANNGITITDDPTKISYDLLAILTHEVGHFIGIAHSSDPTATMYASYAPGSITQRNLNDDDVAAICKAYPPGREATCDPVPRGGFSAVCVDQPASSVCSAGAQTRASSGVVPALSIFTAVAFTLRRTRRKRSCE